MKYDYILHLVLKMETEEGDGGGRLGTVEEGGRRVM